MYVCMNECMYVCVCMYVRVYVCMCTCMCGCMYVLCTYICMHACIYYVYMCVYVFMYLYAGMNAFALYVFFCALSTAQHNTAHFISNAALCQMRSNQDMVSARRIMMLSVDGQLVAGFSGYVLINSGLPSASFSALSIYHL